MDLQQLDAVVQIADLGSVTRAAQALGIAQPALSRQLRALEIELRQPLFVRHGRGVTPTDAGRRLLAHARGILQQVERARHDLEATRGAAAGLLSIALPPSISRTLAAPLVDAFRGRFANAALTVVEALSTYAIEWLVQGRVDCAVVYQATPAPALDLRPVLDEPLLLVSAATPSARRARRATCADVAACDLVMPTRPHALRMRLEAALAEAGLKPTIALEIDSVPAILDLVLRHPLHAVLSPTAIRGSGRDADYAARPIVGAARDAPLTTTLWIATSAQRPRGPLLEQTVALLEPMLRAAIAPADRGAARR